MVSATQQSVDGLRKELRERIDLLSEQRLRSASDFLSWLEQLEDEAEIAMLSSSKRFREEMDAASRAADAAPRTDWRTVRDDV